ncbi:hypothetical protein DPMN_017230 [Dreissena polymorpha]|uniref:Uncharacterized protein n=1 Tax=Dreissena polymorpha TaxID=45954 RepID=A0A9D4S7Y3_DREPO|nr:hypothetical protein DPMN_017230 [Dreissena polymorpha]
MLQFDCIGEANDSENGSLGTLYELLVAMDVTSELVIVGSKRVLEKLGTPQLVQIQLTFEAMPLYTSRGM